MPKLRLVLEGLEHYTGPFSEKIENDLEVACYFTLFLFYKEIKGESIYTEEIIPEKETKELDALKKEFNKFCKINFKKKIEFEKAFKIAMKKKLVRF